ncbi:uncharacterized protein LOC121425476 [Lytechinus variegatus]|uniref:uncharacterized protein LOC121425476 n=1 Tax=Lytechinus variegatus TaxID=7654 RepID=UPI001BB2CD19|nr:uncharacterized protein LOC121425476 [Lytechinus variegatus]
MTSLQNWFLTLMFYSFLLARGTASITSGLSGWQALGKSSYRFVNIPQTFDDARTYCQNFGGDLAQLKSRNITEFVQILIGNHSAWFGLHHVHDLDESCNYRWIDGSSLENSFTGWTGSPVCIRNINCVQLGEGTWQERNCSSPGSFVCENSDIHNAIKRPAEVYQWISNPFDPVSLLKVLVIAPEMEERIVCKHITYDGRDAPTQPIPTSTVTPPASRSSAVHELQLDPDSKYQAAGKIDCGVSSEFDRHTTTTVSAFHLVGLPDREAEPVSGRFTVMSYPGTFVIVEMDTIRRLRMLRLRLLTWTFHTSDISRGDVIFPSLHDTVHGIASAREEDEGTYVAIIYDSNNSQRFVQFNGSAIRLIVPDCPEGRWGPPTCLGTCNPCFNGGICHYLSGSCICPPGFTGDSCLTACGEGRFGSDCEITCGIDQELSMPCAGSQICRPDPYGCNCMSGYTGKYCNQTCSAGLYGVDCLQICHCSEGNPCNIVSGECPGECENGWTGPSCQVPEICPEGFYGEDCSKVCHCLNASCDLQTGFCFRSNGVCASGYMTDPMRGTYCDIYVGCFDSCSKTCHCSEGAPDCNSVTGSCYSGKCSPAWGGPACQTVKEILQTSTISTVSSGAGINERSIGVWTGGSALWALLATILVFLVACLAALLRMRNRISTSETRQSNAEETPSDPTYQTLNERPDAIGTDITSRSLGNSLGVRLSSPGDAVREGAYQPLYKGPSAVTTNLPMGTLSNDYVDEDQPSSTADAVLSEHAYQPLFKGPKPTGRTIGVGNDDAYDYPISMENASSKPNVTESDNFNEYEKPISSSDVIYQNSGVKMIGNSKSN